MTENTSTELSTRYAPGDIEQDIYQQWLDSGLMSPPEVATGRPTFTIMIPPPNVTGVLHMGHALNNTMQDIVARHRRMCGYDTLWLPGTDHAGIATQAVVEKQLLKEQNKTREELGRDAFLAEVWDWKERHGNTILSQLKRLGASCDWSRLKFTLDPEMSNAVRESFVKLWKKGLIYRGSRLVNWDCKLQTAVSDDEIEYQQQKGHMWYLKYPVKDSSEFVTVGTTRPETMLGDTGVAVHPQDQRYAHLIGKQVVLPIVNREIPIIADDSVDRELGTGAVKVTPGHDPADYDRGARNNLPIINILEKDGKINDEGGPFAGLNREDARKQIVAWFEQHDLLEKIEEIVHNVSISDRSKTVVEPLVSEQWFVKMEPLAKPAINALKDGSLRLKPERWGKVYLDWLENVRDWCISRQLWWGHRIPVWYDEDGVPVASVVDLAIGSAHPQTGKPIVRQDSDVLDTWASSWLWPFATLGWPQQSEDLERFYPTQFLSTARDIIYLWVARMVIAGYEFMEHLPVERRCPFTTCYIHATVLDSKGRRMSKSLGNGIDPVEMIEKYGADAVRYSLMILTREGQDVKLAENRFELGQRFCNKIWNAGRFTLSNLEGEVADQGGDAIEDRWISSRLAAVTAEVSSSLEEYDFHDAAQALYRFTWDDYCDWYLEAAKRRLRAAEGASEGSPKALDAARVRRTLGDTLSVLLRLLHPFTPFLSESLWAKLPACFKTEEVDSGLLMAAEWPAVGSIDSQVEGEFSSIQDAVRAFRNVRAMLEISPAEQPTASILADSEEICALFNTEANLTCYLAKLDSLACILPTSERPTDCGTDVFDGGSVFVPFVADTDSGKLKSTLEKKLDRVRNGIKGIESKLGNERFVQNADPEVVESERLRLEELSHEADTLNQNLSALA